jgi:hypothetical protein
MIFKLKCLETSYSLDKLDRYEKLGFRFEIFQNAKGAWGNKLDDDELTITINTPEELVQLQKDMGDLIFKGDTIIIYDDYYE